MEVSNYSEPVIAFYKLFSTFSKRILKFSRLQLFLKRYGLHQRDNRPVVFYYCVNATYLDWLEMLGNVLKYFMVEVVHISAHTLRGVW